MRQIRLICGGSPMPEGFIPPHGGYENLLSYRKAEIVYDATVKFCDRFIDKKSRTHRKKMRRWPTKPNERDDRRQHSPNARGRHQRGRPTVGRTRWQPGRLATAPES